MLKLKYNISSSSDRQEIVLDDMYVSPNLSLVSGTTEHESSCVAGGSVWIRSAYFPNELKADVMSVDVVRRNGYILSPLTLQVHKGYAVQEEESGNTKTVEVYYCEYLGNTYYASSGGTFVIDGSGYTMNNESFVTIYAKNHIEDSKVVVDGIEYNVLVNESGDTAFTDSIGEPFIHPSSWLIFADSGGTSVEKIVIGVNTPSVLGCKSAKYYGHRGYIVYEGDKKYIQYFTSGDTITGAGVIINSEKCSCTDLFGIKDYKPGETYNIYDITDYYVGDGDRPYMTISGASYPIDFEAGEIEDSGIICIETKEEYPQVLIGDRIVVKKVEFSKSALVDTDDVGGRYVYLNMKRYNVIENLCDCVVIGDVEYPISYEYGPLSDSGTTIASAVMGDGSTIWLSGGTEPVKSMQKVYRAGDDWVAEWSITQSGGTASYAPSEPYGIAYHDGILVGEQKLKVNKYEYYSNSGTSAETYSSYEYVTINSMLEYGLKVINTIGSNRILCVPDVDVTLYGSRAIEWLTTEILSSIQGGDFVIERRNNTFGQKDLYYDSWITEASLYPGGTSAYELADIHNNIRIFNITPRFTIPLQLSVNNSQKMAYDNLVRSIYCVEEDEKAINKLVDMEKDIYTPVFATKIGTGVTYSNVDAIVFNLHFRTRDLETWKINIDEGTYTSSGQTVHLSANYQYTNWFVTDYYPFYDYAWYSASTQPYSAATFMPERFEKVIERSDLLGFMYFTTDDARVGREKLRKSFLRLTFFDSKNPEKQNTLGTSTVFLDCDRYMNLIYSESFDYHYEECCASRNPNRTESGAESGATVIREDIMSGTKNAPTVLTQAFYTDGVSATTEDLYTGDDNVVLDSRIRIESRYNGERPSEGFYAYILKAFGDKTKTKTIYMKVEFFHAGLGIKVPMVLPTTHSGETESYSAITYWTEDIYEDFTDGYELKSVFDRMYIPITIEYSKSLKRFVYYIQYEGGYMDTVNRNGKDWMINLFELKTKPQ